LPPTPPEPASPPPPVGNQLEWRYQRLNHLTARACTPTSVPTECIPGQTCVCPGTWDSAESAYSAHAAWLATQGGNIRRRLDQNSPDEQGHLSRNVPKPGHSGGAQEPHFGMSSGPSDRRHGFARSSRRLLFGGLSSGLSSSNSAGVGHHLNTGGKDQYYSVGPGLCKLSDCSWPSKVEHSNNDCQTLCSTTDGCQGFSRAGPHCMLFTAGPLKSCGAANIWSQHPVPVECFVKAPAAYNTQQCYCQEFDKKLNIVGFSG